MNDLTSGHSINKNNVLLKKELFNMAIDKFRSFSQEDKEGMIIITWNNYYDNKTPRGLNWRTRKDEYPTLRGIKKVTEFFYDYDLDNKLLTSNFNL